MATDLVRAGVLDGDGEEKRRLLLAKDVTIKATGDIYLEGEPGSCEQLSGPAGQNREQAEDRCC